MKKRSELSTVLFFACLGIAMTVGLVRSATALAPAAAAAPTTDRAAADRGQGIFSSSCSFCHGSRAAGTEQAPTTLPVATSTKLLF